MLTAPLYGIAEAPVPTDAHAYWLEAKDGARLRVALFAARGAARGSVVLSPGRAEPIEKYFEVIGELRDRGFAVLVHDWRGQGLSQRALADRLKGHAGGFEPFLSDYGLMLDRFGAQLPRPWAVLAHSMGAGLALLALARGEDRFAAAMLTSPMIGLYAVRAWPRGLAERVARGAVRLGLAGVFLEQRYDPFNQPFEGNILTHDRARFERFAAQLRAHPDLAIGAATWGWVDYALSAGTVLMRPESASAVRLPFSVVASGQDKLVMSAFAKRFTEATPRGHYLEIAGAEHEILMEKDPIRALFWRRFDDLIAGISAPSA